jgi:protein-S-isoprenylcysteine O-methyltransferase Ste14
MAARFHWWHFDARGGLLLGVPVDLLLSWAAIWGAVPALVFPSLSLAGVTAIALAADLVLMPAAAPVVLLGPTWLVGEAIGLLAALAPAVLLARWTARDERLVERAVLQVLAFTGLMLFVLPAIAIEGSGSGWVNPFARPGWELSAIAQLLGFPALLGLTAVQEFVTRGGGTPVPFDPPRRLVTTGVYAYVRNPMQLSAVVLLLLLGLVLRNLWVSAGGVMAHIYSAGLAGWDEQEDLRRRFGDDWIAYRRTVRSWVPRLRPWHRADHPPARLFVAESCGMCSEVGRWFASRGARHLVVVAAETHPAGALRRVTYEYGDGSGTANGVEAIARALEHIHLGWALIGFALRLPIVRPLVQLLIDASGGEPRVVDGAAPRDAGSVRL